MKIEELHQIFLEHPSVCTDTRKLLKNDIFFALKGANFNGNAYAQRAMEKGASFVIIDEPEFAKGENYIVVDDTLKTLQQLANHHRNYGQARVIALTGSNGKTTTKELMHGVLSKKYRTIATQGNLNNHIGVPLTLLRIKEDTELAVIEMGANHCEEIGMLCSIAEPDFGYITNFGKAHLEGFGSTEGVIKGKSELYDYLIPRKRAIFMNADDPIQREKLKSYINKYGFSQSDTHFFIITMLADSPYIKISVENTEIDSHLIGSYNFTNCCAAILVGKYFNVPMPEIKSAIESYIPSNNRSEIVKKERHTILLDAYNANPTSMKAALENFKQIPAKSKIVFLGDMFELGKAAPEEHQYIADLAQNLGLSHTFLIGKNFYRVKSKFQKFEDFEQLKAFLNENDINPTATILIKGSRGMALERIVDLL